MKTVSTLLATLALCGASQADHLERLQYNNPGLTVDLGVGLWAWPLPMDFDGDGDLDLVVSCPDKPNNGTYVFENTAGKGVKMPVFKPGKRISKGAHNASISYADGKVFVTTPGELHDQFKTKGLDASKKIHSTNNVHSNRVRANQWKYLDYDGDGVLDLVIGVGDWVNYGWDNAYDKNGRWLNANIQGFVYYLINKGTDDKPVYEKPEFVISAGTPVNVFGMPSPNFSDFDGDGDLDLICGEFLDSFTYYENVGTRQKPVYALGRRLKNGDDHVAMDLEMIVPTAIDWDGDGDVDLICGDEDGRVAFIENTGEIVDRMPVFLQPKYFQQEAHELKFGALVTPVGVDWDGDGDEDIVAGNTAGNIAWFENLSGKGVENPKWSAPKLLEVKGQPLRIMAGYNGSIQGPAEAKWGYTTLSVSDWDHDGLPDLVVNSILGKVVWYKNIGTRQAPKLAESQPIEVEWAGAQPELRYGWMKPEGKALLTQWRTTPVAVDWNKDGLTDLLMMDQEGYLAYFERAKVGDRLILKSPVRSLKITDEPVNQARQKYIEGAKGEPIILNPNIAGKSGRRKLSIVDWDRDGKLDILINGPNASFVKQTKAVKSEWFFEEQGLLSKRNIEGHDVSPSVIDLNGDGIPDFIGGAEDGHIYYMRNPNGGQAKEETSVDLQLKQPGVVSSEFIYEKASFPECHASSIEVGSKGLVATWFGGTKEGNKDVSIWVATKAKNSSTWSAPKRVADGVQYRLSDGKVERHPTWNPVLFQPKTGPLMLFYKVGPSPSTWWGMMTTSNDGGNSWAKPWALPEGIFGPIKNKPVQLASGEILCPTSNETNEKPSKWAVYFESTKDLGKTWQRTPLLNDGVAIQAIQPSVLFQKSGDLLALGRTNQGQIFQMGSKDQGKTWGEISLGNLPNPNSGTDAVTLKDGTHVLVYNHVSKTGGKWGRRSPLNLAISKDDGKTWEAALVLENEAGEFSYPAVIQEESGLLHITYTWKRQKVRHMVVDPTKLKTQPIVDGVWPE